MLFCFLYLIPNYLQLKITFAQVQDFECSCLLSAFCEDCRAWFTCNLALNWCGLWFTSNFGIRQCTSRGHYVVLLYDELLYNEFLFLILFLSQVMDVFNKISELFPGVSGSPWTTKSFPTCNADHGSCSHCMRQVSYISLFWDIS